MKKDTHRERWWMPAAKSTPINAANVIRKGVEREMARAYRPIECHCTLAKYPIVKRMRQEAGLLDIPIVIDDYWTNKRAKCTYRTIRRDCAKRNGR